MSNKDKTGVIIRMFELFFVCLDNKLYCVWVSTLGVKSFLNNIRNRTNFRYYTLEPTLKGCSVNVFV